MVNKIIAAALLCAAFLYSFTLLERRFNPQEILTDNRMIGPEFWRGRKSFSSGGDTAMIPRQIPGPADGWAGGEPKEIAFSIPPGGGARLLVRVLDSHDSSPPKLSLRVNGAQIAFIQVPKGSGASAEMWGLERKRVTLETFIPPNPLKNGSAIVSLITVEGSWVVLEKITVIHPIMIWELAAAAALWFIFFHWALRPIARQTGWLKAPAYVGNLAAAWAERAHASSWPAAISRTPWTWAMILYTLAFLFINHRLAAGLNFPIWDGNDYFLPHFMLLSDYVRQGHLMLWNPWATGGSPSFIEPQVGATSPVTNLFALAFGGLDYGYRFYWMFIWWMGGAGMILLARRLPAPPWAGPVIALAFAFSGIYTGNGQHMGLIYSFSFFPLIIWRLEEALAGGRMTPAAQAGLFWGLSGLAGYPLFITQNGEFAALWALGRILTAGAHRRRVALNGIKSLAIILAVGVVILSPLLVSYMKESKGYSDRSKPLDRKTAVTSNALHPAALFTLASPVFPVVKLAIGANKIWEYNDLSTMCLYTSAAAMALALLALAAAPRDGWRWWLFLMAALALAIAMSAVFPLRGWMYDYIPFENFFRHPAMTRAYFIFFICVLALTAGGNIKPIASGQPSVSTRMMMATLAAAAVALILFLAGIRSVHQAGGVFENTTAVLHFIIAWGGITLAAVYYHFHSGREGGRILFISALIAIAIADAALNLAVSSPIVFNPKSRYHNLEGIRITSLEMGKTGFNREAESRDCFNMIIKVPAYMTYPGALVSNNFLDMFKEPVLLDMYTGAERIWFSPSPAELPPTQAAFSAFMNMARSTGAPLFVLHGPGAMTGGATDDINGYADALANEPPAIRASFDITEYTPTTLAFSLEAPEAGWILVTERWARSWKAWVNGGETDIRGGNFAFRAVKVAKGKNAVRFAYEPPMWIPLLALSWGTILVVAVAPLAKGGSRTGPASPTSSIH